MDIRLLIDRLLTFERRIRRIYLTLNERAAFPAGLRAVWKDMAEEENLHRAFLEQTAGLLNFMQSPPTIPEAVFARMDEKIAAAEAAVQRSDLNIDDALRQALLLEGSELRQLDDAWLRGFHPSIMSLLHAKMPREAAHLRRLCEATYAFSTDAALREQAEAMWATYRQQQRADDSQERRDMPGENASRPSCG